MKFGIIGNGRIAGRFADEIKFAENAEAVALYNPVKGHGKEFAEHFNIELFNEDINAFFDKCDSIYIATPHKTHYEYAKAAISAGKNVLCEKPLALSEKECQELYSLAETKRVMLAEAMKTLYCPGFKKIEELVNSGRIGTVVDIEAAFTRLTGTDCREFNDNKTGGSFTEFASYPLLPIFRFLGSEYKDIRFVSLFEKNGTDGYTKAYLEYDKAFATLKVGLSAKSEGALTITGTKGYILVPSPWWLTRKIFVRYEDPNRIEEYDCEFAAAGLRYEIEAFANGKADKGDAEHSIARAKAMEDYLAWRSGKTDGENGRGKVNIWAHRGCSYAYPENTLKAFKAAAEIKGICGIELDIQRSADGVIVVVHDEDLKRVAGVSKQVKDMTCEELRKYDVPSYEEVLDLLKPYCEKNGLLINTELKTSIIRYEGIEKQALELVKEKSMQEYIVWSSFLQDSVKIIKDLDKTAKTGMLAVSLEDCVRLGDEIGVEAYHPHMGSLNSAGIKMNQNTIRVWNSEEPFYKSDKPVRVLPLKELQTLGVTDVITNVPENYCG